MVNMHPNVTRVERNTVGHCWWDFAPLVPPYDYCLGIIACLSRGARR